MLDFTLGLFHLFLIFYIYKLLEALYHKRRTNNFQQLREWPQ